MANFIVRGIDRDISAQVRATRRAPGMVIRFDAKSRPERDRAANASVRAFTIGADERLLFTYNPLDERQVRFLHLRHADEGWFIARVGRVAG